VEVNFQYGNAGQKSTMNEVSNKEKTTESKERGLRPLLRFIAEKINQFIVWPINEAFEFAFVGLDAMTQDQSAELNTKRVKTMMTIDELRAEDDLEPLPDGKGEMVLDPTWVQYAQMQDGGDEMEGGGEFGQDGDEDDTDFESLLSQYESKEKGDGDDAQGDDKPKPGGKPGKPGGDKPKPNFGKSRVVVDIDF
jgi:hypothetical protein